MADLWSDYTDDLITNIDKKIGGKYKMSVRDYLTNPSKYSSQTNIQMSAKNMKEDANSFIDSSLSGMKAEKSEMDDNAVKADSITKQLSQNIMMQSKQNKTPLIKPALISRDGTNEEVIYVDGVDSGILSLVERLCATAIYVADYTYKYSDKYNFGDWLFSGAKNIIVRVYLPPNEVMSLEASREELNRIFDSASAFLKSL